MRINYGENEKFKNVTIVENENDNTYKVLIKGETEDENFDFTCNKCNNISLSFDILENSTIKAINKKGELI